MEIRNCKRCGRLYTYTGIDLCPECYRQDEEDFMKVRDYLDAHPSATMLEISQNTQVSIKKIMDFLKEGRLILTSNNVNIGLKCEKCGKPILTGRFCEECKTKLAKELMKGYSIQSDDKEEEKQTGERLYVYENNKKKKK
ncbi:flagellar operon protein TIGR03826 [Thermoanaerobacter uzonensis DSM 18761]|uniref:Flagellar operon protein TIGR03826 n=1 Tax=Thermoanaerobacter uzonensis DSM 18761 TaxID=1123369 RepID=A0A1M4TR16_9THEO|nr:TIGR03826 family flagellar region protein [Thermoanaerobacter uzonensis]SHE46835.1 flagellar operon protein TIGR03826 [Thermoanaerobacter uzonensis DSM 18761]